MTGWCFKSFSFLSNSCVNHCLCIFVRSCWPDLILLSGAVWFQGIRLAAVSSKKKRKLGSCQLPLAWSYLFRISAQWYCISLGRFSKPTKTDGFDSRVIGFSIKFARHLLWMYSCKYLPESSWISTVLLSILSVMIGFNWWFAWTNDQMIQDKPNLCIFLKKKKKRGKYPIVCTRSLKKEFNLPWWTAALPAACSSRWEVFEEVDMNVDWSMQQL